jgi:hypothetical protein
VTEALECAGKLVELRKDAESYRWRSIIFAALGDLAAAAVDLEAAGGPKLSADIRGVLETESVDEMSAVESLAERIERLDSWTRNEDAHAAGLARAAVAAGLDKLKGVDAAALRELDEGRLERVRKFVEFARRHSLSLDTVERELHAAELLAAGDDEDVMASCVGTSAFKKLAAKVLAAFRSLPRKELTAEPRLWKKKAREEGAVFEFSDQGLKVGSASDVFAECLAPKAENGYSLELELARGKASVLLQPEPEVKVWLNDAEVGASVSSRIRISEARQGVVRLDVVAHRGHVLVYLEGRPWAAFSPQELVLESVVRIGVFGGTMTIRKVEVVE